MSLPSSLDDFLVPDVSAYPLLVSAGNSIIVIVRFQPPGLGSKSGTISIFSNENASPHVIKVSGDSAAPKLDAPIANNGDFGEVCKGSFADEPLLLANSGKCVLSITGITTSSAEFDIPHALTFPLTIAPATGLPLPIRFPPTSFGARSATLTVVSNDPSGSHKIELSGCVPCECSQPGCKPCCGEKPDPCCDKRPKRCCCGGR